MAGSEASKAETGTTMHHWHYENEPFLGFSYKLLDGYAVRKP